MTRRILSPHRLLPALLLACLPSTPGHTQSLELSPRALTETFNRNGHPVDACNVVWNSPSTDSSGSMPLGNGDLGINLWLEPGGDLLFYLGKTDAWDEKDHLLKLGRVRLSLHPNPFQADTPFHQELRLHPAEIVIRGGSPPNAVTLRAWVDAQHPVVRLEAESATPFSLTATLEIWRNSERTLSPEEADAVDRFAPDEPPKAYPDHVVTSAAVPEVVWYHRNARSIWSATLRHQDLAPLIEQFPDPLLHLTFGGCIKGSGFTNATPTRLQSAADRTRHTLTLTALTAQTASAADWLQRLARAVRDQEQVPWETARAAHQAWWADFWNRSWLRVTTSAPDDTAASREAAIVSQAYALQRFISAASGRGGAPIKFNGSIFTVDVPGKFDGDYRRWGGCYWFQNTRLPYWPMLASGDFDLMQPLFKMYRDALPLARARTPIYYRHGGAFFPETIHWWGAYHNGVMGYGWDRADQPLGRTANQYIRFYWSGSLELLSLMLDYHAFTRNQAFFHHTLLPFAEAILEFYARHYPREPNGRILFAPTQALETWWVCENPTPIIAGLRFVLARLLEYPPADLGPERASSWHNVLAALPPIPLRDLAGHQALSPAEAFKNLQNAENPELYAVFPYRLYGFAKPGLDLARHTFAHRQFKGNHGWQPDDIQAAFLGLADEARRRISQRLATKHEGSRFPAFWGPNFDWIPDQDHGTAGLMALQTMLLQCEKRKILLFPAWPAAWDVEFKLHAPLNTTIEGVLRNGHLLHLNVSPPERARDLVQCPPQ